MQHHNKVKLSGDKAAYSLDHTCITIEKKAIHLQTDYRRRLQCRIKTFL